jgi:hypothetical protein
MPGMNEAVSWFKSQFKIEIEAVIEGTPFTLDMITAIAVQETYYLWANLYTRLPLADVLKLCVGDTIDAPRRDAFPRNKAELLLEPRGDEMFAIAREALESLKPYSTAYRNVANANPDKFCHGFGIFQYDIQFFKDNPNFFLEKRWYDFSECLRMFVAELKDAIKAAYGSSKSSLSDEEMVYVAIAYNTGHVNFARRFKQGHRDDNGKFYGEHVWDYLQLSKSVA